MIPNPALAKLMILVLGGMIALTPIAGTQQKNAGKLNNITKTIIEHKKDPQKLPLTGGFKPGKNPLPEGTTPHQNYINAWNLLKKELGLK